MGHIRASAQIPPHLGHTRRQRRLCRGAWLRGNWGCHRYGRLLNTHSPQEAGAHGQMLAWPHTPRTIQAPTTDS